MVTNTQIVETDRSGELRKRYCELERYKNEKHQIMNKRGGKENIGLFVLKFKHEEK
jgi:hypothetical protein